MAIQAWSREVVRRARCGHTTAKDAWLAQPAQRTLSHTDVVRCVNEWPPDAVIEVRACAGCGTAIARRATVILRPAPPASAPASCPTGLARRA